MDGVHDGEGFERWLQDVALVHKRILPKVVEVLAAEEVFTVGDLEVLARLPRLESCGLTAVTAEKLRDALSRGVERQHVAPAHDPATAPTTPQATHTLAARLRSPPVRRLFSTPDAGSRHFEEGSAASPSACTGLEAIDAASSLDPSPREAAERVQAAARRLLATRALSCARAAATRIQAAVRCKLAKSALGDHRAARTIQAAARRWDLRVLANAIFALNRVACHARGRENISIDDGALAGCIEGKTRACVCELVYSYVVPVFWVCC